MPSITVNEIAYYVCADERIGEDGWSNGGRTQYISEVMGIDAIDLNANFDFTLALESDCPDFVLASVHLATLQLQYVAAACAAEWISADDAEVKIASFELIIRKMGWHLAHLQKNEPTPSFQFIH